MLSTTATDTTHNRPFGDALSLPETGRSFRAVSNVDHGWPVALGDARLLALAMATQRRIIDFLLEQATGAGAVAAKSMFGEYGVYVDGKMVGSVCDDQLFVKPTASGRAHAEPVSDAPPYRGAKPQMLIAADRWEDAEWLGELLRVTANELPTPKPRISKRGT